jgi:Fe-S cluster assembly protein SufB
MTEKDKILSKVTQQEYKYGFYTDIDTDYIEKGLNESVIRLIWKKKKNRISCLNSGLMLSENGKK